MAFLFGVLTARKWMCIGLACFAITFRPFGGELRSDEGQESPPLPPPMTNPLREERAYRRLANPTTVEFIDLGLTDAVQFFSEFHNLPIRIDEVAVAAATISTDVPVTLKIEGAPLRLVLNRVLLPLKLDWYVDGPGLLVTTLSEASRRLDKSVEYEIQIVASLLKLSDAQTQTLRRAGRRDIQRMLDGIQERREKIPLVDDEKRVAELWLEIEQLHHGFESGRFGKESLFRKSLETMLTPEQRTTYDPIREVLQTGGTVTTVQSGPDVLLSAQLGQTAFSDDDLSRLRKLKSLGSLRVEFTKVTDDGLIHLRELPNLRELGLFGTQITDAGLMHLKELTKLRLLVISGTQVTDAGLANLKGLTNLQILILNYLDTMDTGLAYLQDLTSLQWLSLGSAKIDDAGLVYLQKLSNLEQLDLFFAPVTDAGLVHLKGLTRLQRLDLNRTQVSDAGLVHLKGLANLQRIDLGGTQVTDAGLSHIKEMPGLRSLNLQNSKVTDAGIADLKKTLPNLRLGNE